MFAIGSSQWPGLGKVAEEAGEVLQVMGKLMGTGGRVDHWDGTNLRQRLAEELGDLLAAADFSSQVNGLGQLVEKRRRARLALFWKWRNEVMQETEVYAHAAALLEQKSLTKSERKVLVALAQIGKPAHASVVGLVARVSHKTGPFGTTLAELRRSGYVTGSVANLAITHEGLAALGDYAPLPRGHELFEYWCEKLPGSCGKILRALKMAEGPITSKEVGRLAGISSTTGPFGTALATLRKLDFVTGTGKSLELSEDVRKLFEPTIGVHQPSTGRSVRVNREGVVQS